MKYKKAAVVVGLIVVLVLVFVVTSFPVESKTVESDDVDESARYTPIMNLDEIAKCTPGVHQCRDNNAQYEERVCNSGGWSGWNACCSSCNCGASGTQCTLA